MAISGATGTGAQVVASAGSQALIQWLPQTQPASEVFIVGWTYAEHAHAWERGGVHQVSYVDSLHQLPDSARVVIVVNPNNPDGTVHPRSALEALRVQLATRDGLLIVDEAFADAAPDTSMVDHAGADSLVVLRSFGKFYGLAGLRLGFALGPNALMETLRDSLGPWSVTGPGITIGTQALMDTRWRNESATALATAALRLRLRSLETGLEVIGGTESFTLIHHESAANLYRALAEHHILVRKFSHAPAYIRIGLPSSKVIEDHLFDVCAACLRCESIGPI